VLEAYRLSHQHAEQGNYAKAISALSVGYMADPRDYMINLRLGWLHYLNASYANSRKHYKTAISVKPSSIEARLGYQLPLLAQCRFGDVENTSKKILRMDADNYYASLRLCVALRSQKQYARSRSVAIRMLQIYPSDVLFLTELAMAEDAQDKQRSARRIWASILLLEPDNTYARDSLSQEIQ
jgi:tetratricopeptide (TPR) repeat protein